MGNAAPTHSAFVPASPQTGPATQFVLGMCSSDPVRWAAALCEHAECRS